MSTARSGDKPLIIRVHPPSCRPGPLADVDRFHAMVVGSTTIVVRGEIDLASTPDLTIALLDLNVDQADLAGVTFMDAAGFAVLLRAHRRRPGGLTLRRPSRRVMRLLDLIGHRGTFPIVDR